VGTDRSKSNVFKAGDVVSNRSDEINRMTSVQKMDYGSPPGLQVFLAMANMIKFLPGYRMIMLRLLVANIKLLLTSTLETVQTQQTQSTHKVCLNSQLLLLISITDYNSEEVKYNRKSRLAPAPPSSKVRSNTVLLVVLYIYYLLYYILQVMHEFPVVGTGATTSRNDFVRHDILKRENQRLSSLQTNKVP